MQTLESLGSRISSAKDLHSIVRTMKAMAAVSIWQYEAAVASLGDYYRTLEMGIQVILRDQAADLLVPQARDENRLGAVVFGSDQGMCGPFNDHVVRFAVDHIDRLEIPRENRLILAIGARTIGRLEDHRQPVTDHLSVPSVLAGVTPRVQDVLLLIEEWRSARDLHQITLFYNRPLSNVAYRPHSLKLFPLDLDWLRSLQTKKWPHHVLPTYSMDWRRLFSSLIREYIFVSVYRAFAESLASENAARLASMQAAERNIQERLDQLYQEYHLVRQSNITEELLDIMSGFEALTTDGSHGV